MENYCYDDYVKFFFEDTKDLTKLANKFRAYAEVFDALAKAKFKIDPVDNGHINYIIPKNRAVEFCKIVGMELKDLEEYNAEME